MGLNRTGDEMLCRQIWRVDLGRHAGEGTNSVKDLQVLKPCQRPRIDAESGNGAKDQAHTDAKHFFKCRYCEATKVGEGNNCRY